jgi:regulator of RNase E activity RraA
MNECRILPDRASPTKELLDRLLALPTTIISDSQARAGGGVGLHAVAPLPPGVTVGGPALTVRTRPGDNLVVHQAMRLLQPGQVLVVDAGGATDRAIVGEIMLRYLKSQGAAAVVIDGAVRDRDGIAEQGLPVFAQGVCHHGPYKSGPGEIRGEVQVGGAVVRQGDLVLGDADGVVVVAAERAADVADVAEARAASEETLLAQASAGELDFTWVDETLDITWVDGGEADA